MPWEALCLVSRHGPVTTDPFGERPRSLSHPLDRFEGVANLRPEQYAGSQPSLVDLPSYISGYVDGEGCFTVSISPRPALHVGWEVRPGLSVSQNGDRIEVLLGIQQYFACGTLRPDRSDRTVKWEVRSLPLLVRSVIPHFETYPLRSGKETRLRVVRRRLSAHGGRRASHSRRFEGDRATRRSDEPER